MLAQVHNFLGGLGHLFDSLAGIVTTDPQLKTQVQFVVAALAGIGVLHFANMGAFADSLYAVLVLFIQLGLAFERLVAASKK